MTSRDIEKNPYSPDEQRVASWFFEKGIGGGDDPIGSLIALHEFAMAEAKERREQILQEGTASDLSASIDAALTAERERCANLAKQHFGKMFKDWANRSSDSLITLAEAQQAADQEALLCAASIRLHVEGETDGREANR